MQRFEHSVAYKLRYPAQSKITTCASRVLCLARARVGASKNDGKWPCVPHTDTILHLKLDTRTPSTRNGHKLLSQRPRRFDRLLQVPEEERRVGARDDAVVARQCDHHSFFDAHARQRFGQVDYLRFRRSYS
jgi:hypothetical protein